MPDRINKFFSISKFFVYTAFFLLPIFFLPLTIAPVEINKFFIFACLILLSFLFYLFGIISEARSEKTISYSSSPLNVIVLFSFLAVAISAIFSKYKTLSFYGDLSLPDSVLAFFLYLLFYFLAAVHFRNQDIKLIGWLFLIDAILVALLGLLQFFGLFLLPWNFTHSVNFNPIGSIGALALFVGLGFIIILNLMRVLSNNSEYRVKNIVSSWIKKFILGLIGFVFLFIIFATNLKFIWLQIALVLLFLFGYQLAIKRKIDFKIFLSVLFYLIIFAALYWSGFSFKIFGNLPSEIRPNLQATLGVAGQILSEQNFITGAGPSTFTYNWLLFRPAELNRTPYWPIRFTQGFNFILTFASTIGALGILALLLLLFTLIAAAKKIPEENQGGFVIFIATIYLFINLFFYPANLTQLGFLFFGFGIIASITGSQKEINISAKSKQCLFFIVSVMVVLIMILIFQISRIYLANIYYSAAIKNWQNKEQDKAANYLIKAKKLNTKNSVYARELSQAILSSNLNVSIQNAKQAIKVESFEPLNWANLAWIYENLAKADSRFYSAAITSYKNALMLDPYNSKIGLRLGIIYYNSGKFSEALKIFQDITILNPELETEVSKILKPLTPASPIKSSKTPKKSR